jgi:hypothetical protein
LITCLLIEIVQFIGLKAESVIKSRNFHQRVFTFGWALDFSWSTGPTVQLHDFSSVAVLKT